MVGISSASGHAARLRVCGVLTWGGSMAKLHENIKGSTVREVGHVKGSPKSEGDGGFKRPGRNPRLGGGRPMGTKGARPK